MYRMAWVRGGSSEGQLIVQSGIRGGSSEGQLMYRVGLGEGAVRDS